MVPWTYDESRSDVFFGWKMKDWSFVYLRPWFYFCHVTLCPVLFWLIPDAAVLSLANGDSPPGLHPEVAPGLGLGPSGYRVWGHEFGVLPGLGKRLWVKSIASSGPASGKSPPPVRPPLVGLALRYPPPENLDCGNAARLAS